MLLGKHELAQYRPEISELYRTELHDTADGLIHFGIFSGSVLMAVASLKNYMGTWYLRGCVVKPEFRGKGLQRKLIRERLAYLRGRTDVVRVSMYPETTHSIRNIEAEGFLFEKRKRDPNGKTLLVYKKKL